MSLVLILFFGLMFVVYHRRDTGRGRRDRLDPDRRRELLDDGAAAVLPRTGPLHFMAMPFFILAGEIMNRSGITDRLTAFANAIVGHFRGGLAHSNMVASVIMAGMTGAP